MKDMSTKEMGLTIRKNIQKIINERKEWEESSITACFWKNAQNYNDYDIRPESFGTSKHSNAWKVYFIIGQDLVLEGKTKIDEVEVAIYLEKHPKIKQVYDNYGGFSTIAEIMKYIDENNIDGHINEFNKWNAIERLNRKGWVTEEDLKKFIDLTAEDIYNFYKVPIEDTFIHTVENDIESYNLCSGLQDLIDDADKGLLRGLPLYKAPMIDNMIGGVRKGEITMLGGISGAGKTTLMIQWLFPAIFKHNEQLVVMLNEQDEKKMRREMITWVANNIYKADFNKDKWMRGHFSLEDKEFLYKAKSWLEEKESKRNITIIPLKKYSVDLVVKLINKYSGMGVNYFVLDTFKPPTNSDTNSMWLELQQDSVKLYDTVKEKSNNVALWINLQLSKSVEKHRFLGLGSIGIAKNVVDVASTFIAFRKLWNMERETGKKELAYAPNEPNADIKNKKFVPDEDKVNHSVFFVPKSREGGGNYQVLSKNDLGKNTYKELGICYVEEDF